MLIVIDVNNIDVNRCFYITIDASNQIWQFDIVIKKFYQK